MSTETPSLPQMSQYFPNWKYVKPFAVGGLAGCMATAVIQPTDVLKTRIQQAFLEGKPSGAPHVISQIYKQNGIPGFYKGLSAGFIRQLTYTTTRLGIFRTMTNKLSQNGSKKLTFAETTGCSIIAGAIGAFVGNPADVALIRIQTQNNAEKAYRGVFDAMARMYRAEGMGVFFAGATPNIVRGIALNVGMLATFDHFKDFFAKHCDNKKVSVVLASISSGICGATACLPFDLIKTKMQKVNVGSGPAGSGLGAMATAARSIFATGGFTGFYSGYGPFMMRIAPHVACVWLFMEFLNSRHFLK